MNKHHLPLSFVFVFPLSSPLLYYPPLLSSNLWSRIMAHNMLRTVTFDDMKELLFLYKLCVCALL